MDTGSRRGVDAGGIVAALGALLLLGSLFVSWYSRGGGPGAGEIGLSGWSTFEVFDLVLALIAVAVVLAMIPLPGSRDLARFSESIRPHAMTLAAIACALVLFSLVNKPPAARGAGFEIGIWLALLGSVVMLGGLLVAHTGVSLTIKVSSSDDGSAPGADPGPTAEPDPAPAQGADDQTRKLPATEVKPRDEG